MLEKVTLRADSRNQMVRDVLAAGGVVCYCGHCSSHMNVCRESWHRASAPMLEDCNSDTFQAEGWLGDVLIRTYERECLEV